MANQETVESKVKTLDQFGTNIEVVLAHSLLTRDGNPGVIVDVGANVGSTFRDFLSEGWRVFAIEPDPRNLELLRADYGDNPLVTIDPRAITQVDGERLMLHSGLDSTMSTLAPFHTSHREFGVVQTVTMATLCREYDIASIDFLKIDTEGFDLFVLESMNWDAVRPRIIMSEFEDKKSKVLGYTFADMCAYMSDRGYEILVSERFPLIDYDAINPRRRRRFVRYPCELASPDAWGDIICVRDSHDFDLLSFVAPILLNSQREVWNGERVNQENGMLIQALQRTISEQSEIIRKSRGWVF